jgi:serine/threonine protein kinase
LLQRVDQASDSFEDAWAAGQRPPIEAYLTDVPEPERSVLLHELLVLECDYRRRAGETPTPAEYLRRFPEHPSLIKTAFGEDPTPTPASLATPPSVPGQDAAGAPAAGLPTVPGYEVLGELGRGGMGVVYRARHIGLDRMVALKMIRTGAEAGPEELARFRTEAALQARVQHPHIVQIFEVGEAEGRPYFALEFVDGPGLDKQIAGMPQPAQAAAELVETLARAVHHAHQKGLVHRDLKPANVLVTAESTPKVGDFGLARRLEGEAGQTQSGAVVGTPCYMAPEQAWGRLQAIGPATDVHALGAILYELLTGRPPFLGATALDTVLQVRSQEPVPPRRLQPRVPRDLETICLACLHKDPSRRYATAEGLAEDLRRFQAGQPVVARPVRRLERGVKWARRRPELAALLLTLALVLSGSLVGLTGLWWRAEEQRDRAVKAEETATGERDNAVREKQRAVAEAAVAAAVSDFLQNDLLRQADTRRQEDRRFTPDPEVKVSTLLDRAAAGIGERFQDRPLVAAAIRQAIGDAYLGIGRYEQAVSHLSAAHQLRVAQLGPDHPDTLDTVLRLAQAIRRTGRHAEAIPLFEQVRDHQSQKLGPDDPRTLSAQNQLADVHQAAGHFGEAIRLFEEVREVQTRKLGPDHPDTVSTLHNLAGAYHLAGRTAEAIPLFEQAREQTARTLGPDHVESLTALHNLGVVYRDTGRTAEAIPLLEQAREGRARKVGPDHPETLIAMDNLAGAYMNAGRTAEAIRLLEQVRDGWTRKVGPDHPGNLGALNSLALAYRAAGRTAEAVALLEEVRPKVIQKRGPDHPDTLVMLHNLADMYRETGRVAEAIQLFEQVRERQTRKLGPDHHHTWATLNALASTLEGAKQFDRAQAVFRELLDAQARKLPADHPATAGTLVRLGLCLLNAGKPAEAEPVLRNGLAIRQKKQPDHWTTFNAQSLLGASLLGQHHYADAEPLLQQGYEGMMARDKVIPSQGKIRLTEALERLVQLYDAWGKPEQAATWRKKLDQAKSPAKEPSK